MQARQRVHGHRLYAFVQGALSTSKDLTLAYPAAAASPLASWPNSSSGTTNSAVPQSKQIASLGDTQTTGFLIFSSPGKWMPISAVNSRSLTDPQDSHRMPITAFSGVKHQFFTQLCQID